MTLWALELAQVMISTIDPHDREILGLVMTVLGDAGGTGRHIVRTSGTGKVVPVLLFENLQAARPTVGR